MAWILFISYLIFTMYLGYLGWKKTSDMSTFAVGDGNMSPVVVGITLAASTASAATFIINPGFVYVHGLSAFLHLGISVFLGITFMLILTSYQFRRIGQDNQAVTIPGWLGKRYNSKGFALYYSFINLFSFAFLVLLVGGISIVMQQLLGINNVTALLITLIFVTGYVIVGGTYAHVFTNVLQGSLMIIVSGLVVGGGFLLMYQTEGFWQIISVEDSFLLNPINTSSNLYNSWFSVYGSGFLIGTALVCQPHILTKALYVNSDKAVTRYIVIFAIVFFLFTLLLLAGFWAHYKVPQEMLIDQNTGLFRQDLVMTQYLHEIYPPWLFTVISVVLLAAAMSTLDGLLVGLSTILATDLYGNLRKKQIRSAEEEAKSGLRVSQILLVVLAICTFLVCLNPPKLLGIFGQFGVYALVITSLPSILSGIYFRKPNLVLNWSASILAIVLYLLFWNYGEDWFGQYMAFANPAVPASLVILFTTIPALIVQFFLSTKQNNETR